MSDMGSGTSSQDPGGMAGMTDSMSVNANTALASILFLASIILLIAATLVAWRTLSTRHSHTTG